MEKRLSKSIKTLRSDRGGEYLFGEFRDYLAQEGITSQLSAPAQEEAPKNGELGVPLPRHSRRIAESSANDIPGETINMMGDEPDQRVDDGTPGLVLAQRDTTHTQTQDVPHRSGRVVRPPKRYMFLGESYDRVPDELNTEPCNYNEAIQDKYAELWQQAMQSEKDSMCHNQVWDLIEPLEGIKPIGCKCVYKKKRGVDGKVETFKARLVAKGSTQKEGIDYEEPFSPVAMLKSIRILLSIAAYFDYEIWQMDVKTAFLNGNLDECIYMNPDESCVYKRCNGNVVIFLVLYVDDSLLIGNDVRVLSSVKVWLSNQFDMKDVGEASRILGIKLLRDWKQRMLGLSQAVYIDAILARFTMLDSKK
ncbi:hypothetical protein AAC387_Pa09g0670 [Persea americana]